MNTLSTRVREFCKTTGLRMNTDLGQHFLIDESVLDAILAAAKIGPQDHVVEIGSGIGVLTRELLQKTPHVTAIEFDARLVPMLRVYLEYQATSNEPTRLRSATPGQASNFQLIQGNALHVSFPKDPYKIVANIPYHITSPLLRHAFLENTTAPTSLTLLIQREVAEKICDPADAGILTIIVGLFGTPRLVQVVPPSSFLPPPKVHSAVLHIDCFAKPKTDRATMDQVFRLTKHAFGQKRKMLRNTISDLPGGEEALEKVGIDRTRRPQTVSVEEWIALAAAIRLGAAEPRRMPPDPQ